MIHCFMLNMQMKLCDALQKKYPSNFFFRPAQRKCHQMFVISIDVQYLSAFDKSVKKKYLSNVSNKTGKYSEKLKFHLWEFCA